LAENPPEPEPLEGEVDITSSSPSAAAEHPPTGKPTGEGRSGKKKRLKIKVRRYFDSLSI
jgi:hypothetical protein